MKAYLQKTGRQLTQQTFQRLCRQVGAAYRQRFSEAAPDLPEQGSRSQQLWVRHYPPVAWQLSEEAITKLTEAPGKTDTFR